MRIPKVHAERWIVFIVAVSVCSSVFAAREKDSSSTVTARPVHVYGSLIPLGAEVFALHDKQDVFYVLASAWSPEFAGEAVWVKGEERVLKSATGDVVQNYPRKISFRISVSRGDDFLFTDRPLLVEAHSADFNGFITGLRFEMRVYHALESRVLHPVRIQHIGIPPDVPSTERIYNVSFDLGNVPISDRIVVHILTQDGQRLAKFTCDLY